MSELDYRCGKLRTMPTDEWLRIHSAHGEIERKENEVQPPSYHLYTLVCKCGVEHTKMEAKEDTAQKQLLKRTHVYILQPTAYEISGCPVSPTHEVTWSEYEDHLWCFDCEVDFIPEHWGIFDGPIPVGAATMMGLSFDRISLDGQNTIVKMPDRDAPQEDWDSYNATWNRKG
jgi:hypothetical protein